MAGGNITLEVEFNHDNLFAGGYDRDLIGTALMLSASAYNEQEVVANLRELGFENVAPFYRLREDDDMVVRLAYSFGMQSIIVNGEEHKLIAVVIRGTYDDMEWSGNVLAREDGFVAAANALKQNLRDYLLVFNLLNNTENLKFFITGHSRGGAVANILATDLIANNFLGMNTNFQEDNVIAYTFASPNTTRTENARFHYNIVNIVIPTDPITGTPPNRWRHGITFVFPSEPKVFGNSPSRVEQESQTRAMQVMSTQFSLLTGITYFTARDRFVADFIDSVPSWFPIVSPLLAEIGLRGTDRIAPLFFDHHIEVYLAWFLSTDPTHVEYRPGRYRVNPIGQ